MSSFAEHYLNETGRILNLLDIVKIEAMALELAGLRERSGRLFIVGNGGSAANASHAVNDFRKIAQIETYTPTDNAAEFSAWANDVGLAYTFSQFLRESNISENDMLLVLSVGGGSEMLSRNIVKAIQDTLKWGARVLGIVGRDGGYTAQAAHVCLMIPTIDEDRITPHAEEMQSVILHLLVSHPLLRGDK